MIINTNFRHGIKHDFIDKSILAECRALNSIYPSINRIEVTFYKDNKSIYSIEEVSCHISINTSNKQHFDIYEKRHFLGSAFISAIEKAEMKLKPKKRQRKNKPFSTIQLEV